MRRNIYIVQPIVFMLFLICAAIGMAGCVFEDADAEDTAAVVFVAAACFVVYTMKLIVQHFSKEDSDEIDEYSRDLFV